jgi:hypothetical protein
MSQRTSVIVALSAAFVLVLIVGVVSRMSMLPDASDVATATAPSPVAEPQQPSEPDWAGRLEARESEYRARIDEANRRLRRQQAALDEARRQLEQPSPAPREMEHDESNDDDDDDDRDDDDAQQHRFAHADDRHDDD